MVDPGHAMRSDAAVARRRESSAAPVLRLASDQRLVEQVRGGSERAFEALFERHHGAVLGFCRHMLCSPEEAEDVAQHTFMVAYRDLLHSERPVALRPWLYGIARHRCLNVLRDRRRRAGDGAPEPAGDHLPAEVLAREDLRAVLADVAGLPDDQRAALVLAELGDVSHDEIAQILGCRREKVKALVFQARATLIAARASRETPCADIRRELSTVRGGAYRRTALRRHLRYCRGCRAFREQVRVQRRTLGVLLPLSPMVGLKRAVVGALFGSGGTGGATLTVGALSTSGLAATALAMLAIPGAAVTPLTTAAPATAMAPRMAAASTVPGHAAAQRTDLVRGSRAMASAGDTHRELPAWDDHQGQPQDAKSGGLAAPTTPPASVGSPELAKTGDEATPIAPTGAGDATAPAEHPKGSDRVQTPQPPQPEQDAEPPRSPNAGPEPKGAKASEPMKPAEPIGLGKQGTRPTASGRGQSPHPPGHDTTAPAATPSSAAVSGAPGPAGTPPPAAVNGAPWPAGSPPPAAVTGAPGPAGSPAVSVRLARTAPGAASRTEGRATTKD
jgi:RNA polymerase sigma factor (sigma-70 family)